ncbi:MAG TPA: hypothetical protein DCL15_13360, partial [Chloroflexi bacterium]|nr:hypothetical protein [Chloroflexota bacterium]
MAVDQAQANVTFKGVQNSDVLVRKPQTYWSMALASLRRDRLTLVALGFIALIGLLALGAGMITAAIGVSPTQTNPANQFQQPYIWPYLQWLLGRDPITAPTMLYQSGGVPHWLGTDQLGRDQLARLLYGARVSLSIALVAAALSMVLGVGIGAVAGYFGGRVDDVVMWLISTLTTIPEIYLLIIVNSIFRPTPLTLTLFLGFLGWFGTARFMRGNVFKVRALEYTTAARAVGASNFRIMLRHVIPNSLP